MAKKKTATGTDKRKQYEAMFLLPAGASAEMEKSQQLVRGIIERHGGEVVVLKKWDERKLAYEIGGQKRGLYIIAYFRAPGTAVTPIEREVNLSEDIIRVMISDAEHLNDSEMNAVEPQPIIREERPSWERGGDRFDRGGGGGYGGDRYGDRDRDRGGDRGDRGDRGGDRGPVGEGERRNVVTPRAPREPRPATGGAEEKPSSEPAAASRE
jgi:small subunit ribosomal protein S6